MGKRAKVSWRKGIPSTTEGRALAKKNAAILCEAFETVGIHTVTYVELPAWLESDKMPQEVSVVELCDVYDGDGNPYQFMFGHNNGKYC